MPYLIISNLQSIFLNKGILIQSIRYKRVQQLMAVFNFNNKSLSSLAKLEQKFSWKNIFKKSGVGQIWLKILKT